MTDRDQLLLEEQRRLDEQQRFYDPVRLEAQRRVRARRRRRVALSPLKVGLAGAAAASVYLALRSTRAT